MEEFSYFLLLTDFCIAGECRSRNLNILLILFLNVSSLMAVFVYGLSYKHFKF